MPRDITDPVEAVESLGLETVKALVMALRFLAEHSQLKPGYLSLEQLWQHSINVAQLARDLVLFETKDRALAAEALVAGLLHDLGKVVLATNFDDLYGRVHSLARKQPVALWDVEKEMFGASHGEIGGCLVGMWNMPTSVVEAAAFHHEPPLGEHQRLTPLAAVHVANVLEHEIRPSDEFRVAPVICAPFLNEIGLLQRLPFWRAVFAKRRAASAGPEVEPAETSQPQSIPPVPSSAPPPRTANLLPAPAAATMTATSGPPESEDRLPVAPAARQRRWVYAGAFAVVLGLLALWLETPPELPVRALAPAPTNTRAPVVVSPAPAPEAGSRSGARGRAGDGCFGASPGNGCCRRSRSGACAARARANCGGCSPGDGDERPAADPGARSQGAARVPVKRYYLHGHPAGCDREPHKQCTWETRSAAQPLSALARPR